MSTTTSPITAGEKLSAADQEKVLKEFDREGVAVVRGVLSADECAALRATSDEVFAGKAVDNTRGQYSTLVHGNMATHSALFREMMVREPFMSLAEAVVGAGPRYLDTVAIRNGPSTAIDFWHIDLSNYVEFPLPPDVPRHDPRIRMPVFWFSFQIALTDIESPEFGPTQFVPASHYSGRGVPTQDNPAFEGRGPQNIFCRAGDIYLFNHQVWHRGSPNGSDRVRYLMQCQYCNGTMAGRFAGSAVHGMTDEMLVGADPRLLRLIGR